MGLKSGPGGAYNLKHHAETAHEERKEKGRGTGCGNADREVQKEWQLWENPSR